MDHMLGIVYCCRQCGQKDAEEYAAFGLIVQWVNRCASCFHWGPRPTLGGDA